MELNTPHILIVDDDIRILELIKSYLNKNNFRVSTAKNASDAREKLDSLEFDLLIIDIMMPGENGLEFTSSLKKTNLNNPILLLSALGNSKDRINGLEKGADDYLPKPFEPKELLLRINNLLKRNQINKKGKKIVKFGPFKFNLKREILTKENSRIILTPSESKILYILAKNNNEPIYREDLSKILKISLSSRALDVQITRLRHKIEKNKKFPIYLQTVRGRGYVLKID
tara:strand:- start:938 stop:1624 length:687 start_codon:yes stop_codon:yes gene_type:complete